MLGNGFEAQLQNSKFKCDVTKGVSLLAIEWLFTLLEEEKHKFQTTQGVQYEYDVDISYLEVYNEKVQDLLRRDKQSNLVILEDPHSGTVIPGLKKCKVRNLREAVSLILLGNEKRTMAATHSNQFSSRSHAIIQI